MWVLQQALGLGPVVVREFQDALPELVLLLRYWGGGGRRRRRRRGAAGRGGGRGDAPVDVVALARRPRVGERDDARELERAANMIFVC